MAPNSALHKLPVTRLLLLLVPVAISAAVAPHAAKTTYAFHKLPVMPPFLSLLAQAALNVLLIRLM